MTDKSKETFMNAIEMGIDWHLDIPQEDLELYHQLLEERDKQWQQEKNILQAIADRTSLEFAEQAADTLDNKKYLYSYEAYLILLGQLKELIEAGMPNRQAIEAVQNGKSTEEIISAWKQSSHAEQNKSE